MAKRVVPRTAKSYDYPGLRFVEFGSAPVRGKIGCTCTCGCGLPGTDHGLRFTINWQSEGIHIFCTIFP